MRVLIVSNLYPPHHHGGYELRCAQVAEHLHREGCRVHVVTSRYAMSGPDHGALVREDTVNAVPVSRFLRHHRLEPRQRPGRRYTLNVVRQQIADLTRFAQVLDEVQPHVVNWWNLEGVTKALLRMPADRGVPSVYCIDDGWMLDEFGAAGQIDVPFWCGFWQVQWGPRLLRPGVRLALKSTERSLNERGIPTRRFGAPPGDMCFISGFRKVLYQQAGLDVSKHHIIYGGVSPEQFFCRRGPADYSDGPLRLLYAGYSDRRRGLDTIVEALGLLTPTERERVRLSIVSSGPVIPDEYVRGVQQRIQQLGLSRHITFFGRVPHDQMSAVYSAHHVLIFASTANEGMPMVMMEAMCSGCAVPNTGSGGAIELAERAGTPLFPKDHPFALSRLLLALERDRAWVAEVALRGQQTVLREFTSERMLSRTAAVLRDAARTGRAMESVAS